ncbi:DUF7675 family protein [Chryseobacterium koreense]|nr:hypothetical protein [Chryseobacterium koreense]MBB5334727.1 hypothetical protein [Chryseobacterium koreense]
MKINGIEYLDPYKNNETDKVYWLTPIDNNIGEHLFSFDLEKVYNLFADYPWKLTQDEKEIFDKENPYWVEYFSDRK